MWSFSLSPSSILTITATGSSIGTRTLTRASGTDDFSCGASPDDEITISADGYQSQVIIAHETYSVVMVEATKYVSKVVHAGTTYVLKDSSAVRAIDNSTITTNASSQIQTVGIKDNRTSNTLKMWTGTKAQYDAIASKDANTLYNITDDGDVPMSLLNTLYPVGAIYIGTMATCPLQALGVGTWQLVGEDRVLQGAGTRGTVGTTVEESLPNITGEVGGLHANSSGLWYDAIVGQNGVFASSVSSYYLDPAQTASTGSGDTSKGSGKIVFKASDSNATYQDNAPVQQDAYLVNIWRRIA